MATRPDLCSAHGSISARECECGRFTPTASTSRSDFIAATSWHLSWLDGHEHWWLREVRWREEVTRNEARQ